MEVPAEEDVVIDEISDGIGTPSAAEPDSTGGDDIAAMLAAQNAEPRPAAGAKPLSGPTLRGRAEAPPEDDVGGDDIAAMLAQSRGPG